MTLGWETIYVPKYDGVSSKLSNDDDDDDDDDDNNTIMREIVGFRL